MDEKHGEAGRREDQVTERRSETQPVPRADGAAHPQPRGARQQQPSDSYISLDSGAAPSTRSRKPFVAAFAAVACLVLIVVCLGFVHPSSDGGWSVAWLFQTTAETAAGSGEPTGIDDDADAASSAEDASSDADAPASQATGGADTSTSSVEGDDAAAQDGGAEGNSSGAAKPGAAQGGSSASGSGGGDGAGQQPQTVTVSVSIDSSSVGSPVSASGTYTFEPGATAYDALCALGVSVNAGNSGFGVYVSAIGGLAEKEHGATSGWLYIVNGTQPATAASNYELSDGDVVRWVYSVSE
ncbi:DUF4430 domain-containing protein [uncultured Enorma sp.]|uniref:DUF4430 domain-containing protein n=1 Tax=uncultured Enorma sp. TaxID=1714346 RepID=UPI002804C366|nr:DUF4430 domain-containing protein [uncultured Enorma sp.]